MIRYHLDENVHHAVARALRLRGIDVTTTSEAGLMAAPDEDAEPDSVSLNAEKRNRPVACLEGMPSNSRRHVAAFARGSTISTQEGCVGPAIVALSSIARNAFSFSVLC